MNKKLNLSFYKSILYSDFAYDKNRKKMLDILVLHKEMKQFLRLISFIKNKKGNLIFRVDKSFDYFLLKNFFESVEFSRSFKIKIFKNYKMSLTPNNFTLFLFFKRYLTYSNFSSMLHKKIFLFSSFNNSQNSDYYQSFYKIQNDINNVKKKLFLIGFLQKICEINIKK